MRPMLTVIVDPSDRWMDRAACRGQAGAYDETATRFEQRKAREQCLTSCPVLNECYDWARRTKYTGTAAGITFLDGRRRGHPESAAS
ncbi:WhiB family transcriptional regulator [Kribbella sp. NBC_01505]|uniref:WhiB family transcriptional regulator n=1 Tax=Kribbella sp. NBC_01505 TaxID=2903580 RepID=UPI0038709A4B